MVGRIFYFRSRNVEKNAFLRKVAPHSVFDGHHFIEESQPERLASFFFGVRIRLGMTFNYLILWVRVKGQG